MTTQKIKKSKIKEKIKEEDLIHGLIESVGKESDKVWKKSVEKKSSPHMSVDQIADRADQAQYEYARKVASGKGLKHGGIIKGFPKIAKKGWK